MEKQNVDCMIEKLKNLKGTQIPGCICYRKLIQELKPTLNDNVSSENKALPVLVCIFYMQILLSFCHCYCKLVTYLKLKILKLQSGMDIRVKIRA